MFSRNKTPPKPTPGRPEKESPKVAAPVAPTPPPAPAPAPVASQKMPSIISQELIIQGNLLSKGDLQIDGSVEGDVRAASVTIGHSGRLKGNIHADTVRISGSVVGRVDARQVSLASTAKINGDLVHDDLIVEAGANLVGQVLRRDARVPGSTADAPTTKAPSSSAPAPVKSPPETPIQVKPSPEKKASDKTAEKGAGASAASA